MPGDHRRAGRAARPRPCCLVRWTARQPVQWRPPSPPLGWLALASHRCSRAPAVCRFWIPAFFGTRRHMTGDPMLLMLGDHIYRSTHEQGTSCVRQHVWHANLGILGRAASCGPPRVAIYVGFPHCGVNSQSSSCCRFACALRCSSFSRPTMADRSWRQLMCNGQRRVS